MTQKIHTPFYTAEFRARGVRLFKENRADYASDNAAYRAIAPKLGCSADSLRAWCRQADRGAATACRDCPGVGQLIGNPGSAQPGTAGGDRAVYDMTGLGKPRKGECRNRNGSGHAHFSRHRKIPPSPLPSSSSVRNPHASRFFRQTTCGKTPINDFSRICTGFGMKFQAPAAPVAPVAHPGADFPGGRVSPPPRRFPDRHCWPGYSAAPRRHLRRRSAPAGRDACDRSASPPHA